MLFGSFIDISVIMCLVILWIFLVMCVLGSCGFNRWLIRFCSWFVCLIIILVYLSSDGLGNVLLSSCVVLCKLLSGFLILCVRLCIKLWVVICWVCCSCFWFKWCWLFIGVIFSRIMLFGICWVVIERICECLLMISVILLLVKFCFVFRFFCISLIFNEK